MRLSATWLPAAPLVAHRFLGRPAPIDGVGIQGHFFAQPRPEELQANLQLLAEMRVIVEFTEVDVRFMPERRWTIVWRNR